MFGGQCVDSSYEGYVSGLVNTTIHGGRDRSWIWQTCTEFGFYSTCDPGSKCLFTKVRHASYLICEMLTHWLQSPYILNLQSNFDICQLAFNISGNQTQFFIDMTNVRYGLSTSTRCIA